MKKTIVILVCSLFSAGILIQSALGKDYPTKPIEILIPYTPGGNFDLQARLVADIARKYLSQPMVVVNKPGAGGSVAAADIIASKADGYKFVMLANHFFSTTTKAQKLPFDPKYVVPIVNFSETKNGLMVRGDSPWKTLNALLEYGRKNPGKLTWNHSGRGSVLHIGPLLIFRKAGVEAVEVPYPGNAEMLTALLGGHVDASSFPYGAVKDQVKAGLIRTLVFFNDERYNDPAGVPCAVELGFPEAARLRVLLGLYAHKDTPDEVKTKITETIKKVCGDPEFKKGMDRIGEQPRFAEAGLMRETIVKGEEVSVPILKELGLYVAR